MTTLKEIAKAAGVSVTTVSNVINGNLKRVSSDTVEKILSLINDSGYVPNQAARSLAQRESNFVAVIVQASEGENIFRNPYTAEYIGALTVELYKEGYYPLIRFTDDYKDVEKEIRGWNVAGAIFSGTFSHHLQNIKSLTTLPTVLTDCYFQIPGVNYVSVDDKSGGQLAGEYLSKMGHSNIAFLANDLEESDVDQQRLLGFKKGLKLNNVSLLDKNIIKNPYIIFKPQLLKGFMENAPSPTAFFCTSDKLAAQLIQALNQLKYNVPQDISVLGFDNLSIAELIHPQLSTLAQNISQKAQLVVNILVRHIQQKSLPPERTLLGVWLVERQSVRKL